ncbi:sensor domain-containing diguanylate cyclase [Clostridium sp. AM58-1XD]|uniref:sensor domain-containing diguanylate cyclase n=1 Tax=Clostridium sp. AM58-1XD TaxID=2292307 RepID=UPI0015F42861|nr:sensor domain-containing diguanylate cyclase [Clostridium sp. AM58-1XD]
MCAKASRLTDFDENGAALQVIITDITQEREQRRKVALNEERYRIISEQTRDTVYDWDIIKDRIQFSPTYEKMFGFCPPENISITALTEFDIVHEDDKLQVQQMIQAILNGSPQAFAEYRAKCADGSYLWCRNQTTTIFDDDGKPVHVIGVLSDINDLKLENAVLQKQVMRDSLTGLLNRMAVQKLVERRLFEEPEQQHIFLLIDIDRFKEINDTLGHSAGDHALRWLSSHLKRHFCENDLVGRMGGDEFSVFLTYAASTEIIRRKVERLTEEIARDSQSDSRVPLLSISAGTAVYPKDGQTFAELYRHADTALYAIKRRGGNGYALYGDQNLPEDTEEYPSHSR